MREPTERISVLHVDDDPDITQLASTFLERTDDRLDVHTATSPEAGLTRLEDLEIDCIVSDYDMPQTNGIDFLETVREHYPGLPFILYTGKGSEEIASDAISAGVSDYLQKESGTDQYTILANRITNLVSQRRAEEQLSDTHDYYTRILNHASDYILIVNETGRVEYVSPAVERVTGHTPAELQGTDAFDLIHPDDHQIAFDAFTDLLSNPGDERTVEYRIEHADGSWRWIEVRGRNLLTDPVIDGVLVTVRDITDRKTQEKTLQTIRRQFKAVLENSITPMFMKADDGSYIFVNQAYRDLFDLEDQEILGKTDQELHPPNVAREVRRNDQRVLDHGEAIETEEHIEIKGEERIYLSTKVPIYDTGERANPDTPVAVFGVATDITERKQQTRQLDTLISNLPGIVYRARNKFDWPMDLVRGECKTLTGYPASALESGDVSWGTDIIHPEDQDWLWDTVQEAVSDNRPFEVTYRIRTKDDAVRWVWERGRFIESNTTEELVLEGFITDITEQKHREEDLARVERRYRAIFDDPNILVGLLDLDGKVLEINQTAMEYIDTAHGAVVNKPLWETPWFAHSTELQQDVKDWIERAAAGEYVEFEADLLRPTGEPYTVEGVIRPVTNEKGEVVSLLISDRDVTERKTREAELERMHAFFKEAERLGTLGAWEVTATGDVIWTEGTRRIHEVSESYEPTLESGIAFYHPEDRARIEAAVESAFEEGEPYDVEARLITANDNQRWIRTRGNPMDDGERLRGYIQDITDRKERELELDRQLDLFEKAQDIANVGAWEYDIAEDVGWWTEEAARIHGLPEDSTPSPEGSFQHYHPADRPVIEAAFERAISEGEPYDLELRFIDANGDHKWVRTRGEPQPMDGDPEVVRGTIQDVTDRKTQEQDLQASQERFESLFNSIRDAIVVADSDRKIIACNPAFTELFGYTLPEIEGESTTILYEHPEEFQSLGAILQQRDRDSQVTETITYEAKSGYTFPGETDISYLRDVDGAVQGFIGLIRDISDREDRLRQLKMIDRVLRHNLRNDLNVIIGHAELIQSAQSASMSASAEIIAERGHHLLETADKERMITEFLADNPPLVSCDIVRHMRSAVETIRDRYPGAEISVNLPEEQPVRTTERFVVALEELLENAIIHSEKEVPTVRVSLETLDDMIELRISDDGPGLPELERRVLTGGDKFTPLHHGSGYGLWLVNVLVRYSNGKITVTGNGPRGTLVKVRLPIV